MSNTARDGSGPGRVVRVIAAVVLCALALPAGLPVVAGLAHELYHVSERLSLDYLLDSHMHLAQGAPGDGHGHPHAPIQGTPHPDDVGHTHPVHPHGSSTSSESHQHAPAVDALLTVAGGDEGSEIAPPSSADRGVDLHLPAVAALVDAFDPSPAPEWAPRRNLPLHFTPALDPPPPRV